MSHDIVITHRAFPETVTMLHAVGNVAVPATDRLERQELRHALSDARGLMAFMPDRIDDAFLDMAPRLEIIAAALKGYDNIDLETCTARGIWLSIVPDLLTNPTAELAIGLMIGLARHVRDADAYVRSGKFTGWSPRFYGRSIEGSTVGLVGMGAIGRAIGRRLRGFDCRLICYDELVLEPEIALQVGVEQCTFEELLGSADFIVLCLPLRSNTVHLINEATVGRMKPGALLINPARGSLVDEAAIAKSLAEGYLGGYAADAFELEDHSRAERPKTIASELLASPRCLFGAHIGSATTAARKAIEARAASNILDVLAGRPPRDAVNAPRNARSWYVAG